MTAENYATLLVRRWPTLKDSHQLADILEYIARFDSEQLDQLAEARKDYYGKNTAPHRSDIKAIADKCGIYPKRMPNAFRGVYHHRCMAPTPGGGECGFYFPIVSEGNRCPRCKSYLWLDTVKVVRFESFVDCRELNANDRSF